MKTYNELIEMFNNAKSKEEVFIEVLPEYPDIDPITGCYKCSSYYFEEGIVYVTDPAYDAYILTRYNSDEKDFWSLKFDMDNDTKEGPTIITTLEEVKKWDNWKYIKEFYDIPENYTRIINK